MSGQRGVATRGTELDEPGSASAETPRSSVEPPLVDVRRLCRWYGNVCAVDELSFAVQRGEIVGFLGPNGAGKSTTLRTIVGYLAPSSGQVLVAGHDVVEEPHVARRRIGYMPEAAALYPEMRVAEYLRFRARLKCLPKASARREVEQVMEKAGVGAMTKRLIGGLSRGYRQRVALADALLGAPPLLILDEPTAGLDPNQIRSVRSLLTELAGEHTVLLSTHVLSEVESTCSRAVVIDRGRLLAEGPIAELRRQPGSQRALVALRDVDARAFGILVSAPGVLGVTPRGGRGSVMPPALDARAYGSSSSATASTSAFELTFQQGNDPHERLAHVVELLVRAGVQVREARVCQTSLEEVFGQLTSIVEE